MENIARSSNVFQQHSSGTAALNGYNVLYIPNFVTEDEEDYLVRKIQESPQPKWKKLQKRRLQIWGGEMTAKGTLCEEPLPTFVCQHPDLIGRIKATGVFNGSPHGSPNHIIMNEYEAGQGIMPHEDGPKYHPVVATLSLGSHSVFHYYRYNETESPEGQGASGSGRSIDRNPVLSLLLERRSLVISFNDMYTSHLHG
ncbi:hypothetical protein FA13DRAFT_1730122 [Coprinellus micaceus]|uniref:Fe2OG dioxygenase domain-containing protein n=1 Tax=Coprinellus micaceus TaxID=71717 RepID=A0A4Y7TJX5_COPMI|nr:hypothetical protein FA13DRAFT_1730122 [Coprinellus micaceus]